MAAEAIASGQAERISASIWPRFRMMKGCG
jgi:hypothetical protein